MIIITGKSWSGKTTLSKQLQEAHDYEIPYNVTTRKPREYDDFDYSEYRFVSKEHFQFLKDKDLLLNHTEFNWNQYWTTWIFDEKTVFVVDQSWREDLLKLFPTAHTVWVEVSSFTRRKRLFARGLEGEALENRIDWPSEQMVPSESCIRFDGTQDIKEGAKNLISLIEKNEGINN